MSAGRRGYPASSACLSLSAGWSTIDEEMAGLAVIGRDEELAGVAPFLDRAEAASGSFVLTGAAGVGKTEGWRRGGA
jgi:hypothetical protein